MKQIDVAIAVVFRDEQVLICKRRQQDHLGGFWEFPGGKIEPEETLEACLHRELCEEVNIEVQVVAALSVIEHEYLDRKVRLHPFLCAYKHGEPSPIGCDEVRWTTISQLQDFTFPPANDGLLLEIVQYLRKGNPPR